MEARTLPGYRSPHEAASRSFARRFCRRLEKLSLYCSPRRASALIRRTLEAGVSAADISDIIANVNDWPDFKRALLVLLNGTQNPKAGDDHVEAREVMRPPIGYA
jgi:hypothetical protein